MAAVMRATLGAGSDSFVAFSVAFRRDRTSGGGHLGSPQGKDEERRRAVAVPVPTAETRWRCTLCGNLTRFDVTRSTRAREYVHLDLGGEPRVEEREVLADTVERVTCRWCRAVDSVVLVPRPVPPAEPA
jgi:hypothetical protein